MDRIKAGHTVVAKESSIQGLVEGETYTVKEVSEDFVRIDNNPWWFSKARFQRALEPYNEIEFSDTHYGEFSAYRKNDGSVEIELDGLSGYTFLTISAKEFEKLVDKLNEMV